MINIKNKIFGMFGTFFVLYMLMFLGVTNAVEINVNFEKNIVERDDSLIFKTSIDIQGSERLPAKELKVEISNELGKIISYCYFDVNGLILNECSREFEDIKLISSSDFSSGFLNGNGYGYNTTNFSKRDELTIFGYGYGYFYDSGNDRELEYEILWNPMDNLTDEKLFVTVKVFTQENSNDYIYVNEKNAMFEYVPSKPVALADKKNYVGKEGVNLIIDASDSYDLNNYTIINYFIKDGDDIIAEQNSSLFQLEFEEGDYDLDLFVVNELGVESEAFLFDVGIEPFLDGNTLKLEVNEFIENQMILFKIITNESIETDNLRLKPVIECLNVPIEIKADEDGSYLDSMINFNEGLSEYYFQFNRFDLDLSLPMDVSCNFVLSISDKRGKYETKISDMVVFKYGSSSNTLIFEGESEEQLIKYIYKSFNSEFNRGYNIIDYEFVNNGVNNLEFEVTVTSPDLNLRYTENINVGSNRKYQAQIPFYISERVESGKYPVRISYRVDNNELKTKYGFIEIK